MVFLHKTPGRQYKSDTWPLSVGFPVRSGWLPGRLRGGQSSETCWRVYWLALSHRTSVYTVSCWWAFSLHTHGSITQCNKNPLFVQLTSWTPHQTIFTCDTFVQLDIMRLCREAHPHSSWYTVKASDNKQWTGVSLPAQAYRGKQDVGVKLSRWNICRFILIMVLVFMNKKVLQKTLKTGRRNSAFLCFPPISTFQKGFPRNLQRGQGCSDTVFVWVRACLCARSRCAFRCCKFVTVVQCCWSENQTWQMNS